jgi:hypothetical protein
MSFAECETSTSADVYLVSGGDVVVAVVVVVAVAVAVAVSAD